MEINIDSQEVITVFHTGNLHYNAIIDDCRSRLRRTKNPVVVHCFMEQNRVVGALAKKGDGFSVELEVSIFKVPSMFAQQSLWTDIVRTYFVGRIKTLSNHFEGGTPNFFVLNPD